MRVEVGRLQMNKNFWLFMSTSKPTDEGNDNPLLWKSQRIRKWLMGTLIEAVKPNFFWEVWDRKSLLVNIYLTFEPIRTCTIHKQETNSPILRLKASLKANWCWLERWWKNSSQSLRTKFKMNIEVWQYHQHLWHFQTIKIRKPGKKDDFLSA